MLLVQLFLSSLCSCSVSANTVLENFNSIGELTCIPKVCSGGWEGCQSQNAGEVIVSVLVGCHSLLQEAEIHSASKVVDF